MCGKFLYAQGMSMGNSGTPQTSFERLKSRDLGKRLLVNVRVALDHNHNLGMNRFPDLVLTHQLQGHVMNLLDPSLTDQPLQGRLRLTLPLPLITPIRITLMRKKSPMRTILMMRMVKVVLAKQMRQNYAGKGEYNSSTICLQKR